MSNAALSSIGNLLAGSDASAQRQTRSLIEEIVNSILKAKSFEPEAMREKAFQKRAQELALKAQNDTDALGAKLTRLETIMKKRMKDCEDKVDALTITLTKQLDVLQKTTESKVEQISVEIYNLWKLRDEFNVAISKERDRRLKLFTRWNNKHGSDVEQINEKLHRELSYLSKRSNHEFNQQTETLELLKDKLDYALLKRYGYIPDLNNMVARPEPSVGEDEEQFRDPFNDTQDDGDHLLLHKPRLKGTFNLAVDAGVVISTLDNRIEKLSGQVKSLADSAAVVTETRAWERIRKQRVRNEGSEEGSASESNYGHSDSDDEAPVSNPRTVTRANMSSSSKVASRGKVSVRTSPQNPATISEVSKPSRSALAGARGKR